jgi:succinate dehydrogenase / fumarate reductase, cytochrome b subunit
VIALRQDTWRRRAAWILQRGSGIGVLVFLVVHVGDTALVRVGPEAYDTVVALYRSAVFRSLEIVLMGAVLFHAFNGIRLTIQDLWGGWLRYERPMLYGTYGLTGVFWVAAGFFMAIR